jgi:predicted component of type VI protein secretion system
MFPMTITINNRRELDAVLTMLPTLDNAVFIPDEPAPKATKQEAKVEAPKAQPTAAASVAPPAATPATPASTAADSGDKPRTIDEAKALTMKIVADKGRDTAVELLKKFGVPVAAKLAADQVAAFCSDAEAVLAS